MLVDGVEVEVPGFDSSEVSAVLKPLTDFVEAMANEIPPSMRLLIGVCGPPGSGKSVFAVRWIEYAESCGLASAGEIIHVPMDGYHLPNAVLDQNLYEGTLYPGMSGRPLREIKGAPETFERDKLIRDLRSCSSADHGFSLPSYDRRAHDPVPDGILIRDDTKRVILDGNYLVLEEDGWSKVGELLNLIVFLQCSEDECTDNLLIRHQRGGRSRAAARKHIEAVDIVNYHRVVECESRAHVVVRLESRRVVEISRRNRR